MAKITTKKYACARCGHVTEQATNHYGSTWSWGRVNCCPNCPPWAKYSEFGGQTIWKCLEVEGRSEERLRVRMRDGKSVKPGDEIESKQSFDSPPGIGRSTYRITRVDDDGTLYGVKIGYDFNEFSGEDMR